MQQFNMKQKEEYKETEIGLLPENWRLDNIVNYVDFQRGTEPGSDKYNKNGEGIRFLRVVDISGSRDDKIYTTLDNVKRCQEVDVLITFDGSPGIIKRGLKGAYSSGIRKVIIKDKEKIKLDFIYYVLQTNFVQEIIQKYSTGVTIKHASKSISHIKIPLPSHSEQKKIANVLSTIQEVKEKTENVINSLKELKKSMMKHLFTYGLVSLEEAENVKLKETEIGEVPEGWEVNNIGELYNVKQGKQISAKESKEGKIKKSFLRTSNLTWGKINILKVDSMYFTKEKFEKLKLKKGDILTCEGGDIGRTAIYDDELEECAYQNHLHRLRPKTGDTNNLFFVYWMNYAANQRKLYVFDANRTTIPNLSGSRLKNFKIPKPELSEQQQISSILSTIDSKIESEENKKNTLEELFKSMLHNLMTAKIRINNLEI